MTMSLQNLLKKMNFLGGNNMAQNPILFGCFYTLCIFKG